MLFISSSFVLSPLSCTLSCPHLSPGIHLSIYLSLSPLILYSSNPSIHPSIHPFSRLINSFPSCTHSQFCQSFNHHSFSLRFFNDPPRKLPHPNISRRFVLLAVNTLHINCKVTHFFDLLDQILQIKTHTYHLDRVGFDSPDLSDSQVCMALRVDL